MTTDAIRAFARAKAINSAMTSPEARNVVCEGRTITPDFAKALLELNGINRPLSDPTLKNYTRTLENDKWKLNGETIKVTTTGRLLDGQHRLLACVEANKSFDAVYVEVEDETAFDTIDIGKRRTRSDILSIKGEKHTTVLGSVLPLVKSFYETGKITSSSRRCPNFEVDQLLQKYPDLREHVAYASNRKNCGILYTKASIATTRYILSKINASQAEAFIEDILYGEELASGSPALAVRNHMLNHKAKKGGRTTENNYVIPVIFIAWNALRARKNLRVIKYEIGVDEFPTPV